MRPGRPAVTALVLAGGAASRMGGCKAERRLGGRTLLEYGLRLADAVADEVLLLPGARPLPAEATGRRLVADWPAARGGGPLAALGAGLEAARHPWCLLLPCDMPWLRADVVERLIERAAAASASTEVVAVRRDGDWQPFPALFRKPLAIRAADELAAGRSSLLGLIERSAALAVAPDELVGLDPDLSCFRDLDTLDELRAAGTAELRS